MPPPPPPSPPPPLPIYFPLTIKKKKRLSDSSLVDQKAEKLRTGIVETDAQATLPVEIIQDKNGKPKVRLNTMTGTKKSTASNKFGYGWGIGRKQKEVEAEMERSRSESPTALPVYQSPRNPPTRSDSRVTQGSKASRRTQDSQRTQSTQHTKLGSRTQVSSHSKDSNLTSATGSTAPKPRPPLLSSDSIDTLVGSSLVRKQAYSDPPQIDTSGRLEALREEMTKIQLDYYIVPSADAHGSEYVVASDKRREFISGFTGSAGEAIVSKSAAYLVVDSRYWDQAERELDQNLWTIVRVGGPDGPKDWIEWLMGRIKDAKIGIDARMLSHEKSVAINSRVNSIRSKMIYPPQNLIDLIWKNNFAMEKAAGLRDMKIERLEVMIAELSRGYAEATHRKESSVGQSGAVVAEFNRHLQEEKAKVSKLEEADRQKEMETKRLEEKVAELRQRLQGEAEASRRRAKDVERLEAQLTETERRSQEKTVKLSNLRKEKVEDIEQLEAKVAELEQRLQEKTAKLSNMEEIARQNSKKERETQRLETKVAELECRLQEKTLNAEASRRNSRKGEGSKQLESKVTELEQRLKESRAKISSMEADAKRREHWQTIRRLPVPDQKHRRDCQTLIAKADTFSAVEVENLVRVLNVQIEQVSSLITDSISYQESPGSSEQTSALSELRDYFGQWLFDDLSRRSNEPQPEYDPLITQIALQTVLVHACSCIINHWNPPFWDDDSKFFQHCDDTSQTTAGTITMPQTEIRQANVNYLSEILVKSIAGVGGTLQDGKTLLPKCQEYVEAVTKRALELYQLVRKDSVISMNLLACTIPSDALFDPSQMDGTKGSASSQDRVICTIEMGLQYWKRAEFVEQGGEECGVALKPKVVLSADSDM